MIDVNDLQRVASRWGTSGTFVSDAWQITGNSNIDPNLNFLGTTDQKPLILKTNEQEAMRVTDQGLIGIGTASPIATLDIKGWNEIPSDLVGISLNVNGDIFAGRTGNNIPRLRMSSNGNQGFVSWNGYYDGTVTKNIDSTKPAYHINMQAGDGIDAFQIQRAPAAAGTQNLITLLHIDGPSGNVGIGTTNPGAKVHITSTNTSQDVVVIQGNATHGGSIPFRVEANPQSTYGLIARFNHAVYLGWLDVQVNQNGDVLLDSQDGQKNLVLSPNGGNVGIGTTTPAYKLDVAGVIHSTGFSTLSDARVKGNVTQISNALDKLEKFAA